MYVTTNSALVWKRMADENQQSAKFLARISLCLLLLMGLTGGYAYTAHARYSALCSSIESEAKTSLNLTVKKISGDISKTYCS